MTSATPTDIKDELLQQLDDLGLDIQPREQKRDRQRNKKEMMKNKNKNKKKDTITNPLQKAIQQFLDTYCDRHCATSSAGKTQPTSATTDTAVIAELPRKFTIYGPLLLLPVNVFTAPPVWAERYASLSDADRRELYAAIAASFSSRGVTHVAMNAPILMTNTSGLENRMRSPAGLVPLYGNFGELLAEPPSCQQDFEEAFWTHTVQNGGITQCWAPLYTMFSRGNVTEKARILGHEGRFTGLDEASLQGQRVDEISVVDLYAGIGYFVFSYLKRGVKRVWGWELNAWSVEGLRRGCLANGWNCKVVPLNGEDGQSRGYNGVIEKLLEELTDDDRVVIFQGDNQTAPAIVETMQPILERRALWAPIRHVNLGLLPTSQPTWETSLKLLDREYGGWTHVHENVDIAEIESKKGDIVAEYATLAARLNGPEQGSPLLPLITCDHVENVKTYAPGVMHCVYDIQIDFDKSRLVTSDS